MSAEAKTVKGKLPPRSDVIMPLYASRPAIIEAVGGKASNLMGILRAGFAVPQGYIVTSAAYDEYVEDNGIRAETERSLSGMDPGDRRNYGVCSSHIKGLFMARKLLLDVADEIGRHRHRREIRPALRWPVPVGGRARVYPDLAGKTLENGFQGQDGPGRWPCRARGRRVLPRLHGAMRRFRLPSCVDSSQVAMSSSVAS